MVTEMGQALCKTLRLGGGEHRRDIQLLSLAAAAPQNLKSTNMLERLMEEIKRRTLVVRIFPNAAACLRLVRALAVEIHENWIEAMQYLNMDPLQEQKKEALRKMGDAA